MLEIGAKVLSAISQLSDIGMFPAVQGGISPVALARLTLLFGENGRGKSTLSDVFRSLATGDTKILSGRKRLGIAEGIGSKVRVRHSDGEKFQFENGAWSASCPAIKVFDDHYITENIYAGNVVGPDQKTKLLQVILGEEGVRLQSELARLTELHGKQKAQVALFAAQKLGFSNVEDAKVYAEKGLPENYDEVLAKGERVVQFNRAVAGGVADENFCPLELFDPIDELQDVLAGTVAGIEQSAAEKVKARVKELGPKSEEWLKEGNRFSIGENCPFCTQALMDLDGIISAYSGYFSEAYEAHVEKIVQFGKSINERFGPTFREEFLRRLAANEKRLKALRAAGAVISINLDEFRACDPGSELEAIHKTIRTAVERKYRTPLEPTSLEGSEREALASASAYSEKVESYNQAIEKLNRYLTTAKEGNTAEARATAEANLSQLKSLGRKTDKGFANDCKEFVGQYAEMLRLDAERKRLQNELKGYGEAQSESFIAGVNSYLECLGADFKLRHKKPAFRAKDGTAEYALEINDVEVPLGAASAGVELACFKTTLSTGDRRALALAFFLNELEEQDNLEKTIVVMDDPFSSFDANRRRLLIDLLVIVFPKIAQLLVLSHDMRFLRDVCQEIDKTLPKAERSAKVFLQIKKRTKSHSEIISWDHEYDLAPQVIKACRTMCDHLSGMRPMEARFLVLECKTALEMFFKNAYPSWIRETDNLERMVKQIADDDHPLNGFHEIAKKINRLTPEYGHGGQSDRVEIETDEADVLVREVLRAISYREYKLLAENNASIRSLNESSGHAGVDFTRRL